MGATRYGAQNKLISIDPYNGGRLTLNHMEVKLQNRSVMQSRDMTRKHYGRVSR